MSENGVNGHNVAPVMEWRVGFMNHALKYLTAETFGHKVNVSGTALKKKQIWFLEQDPTDNWVYIRSHLGFYATSDKYGKVTVEAEEKTESERFLVEYSNSGKWAFKHVMYGNYLSGVDDNVKCFSKAPVDKEWWSIQLDVHPQVCLRNVNRKRYARLNGDELECKEIIPWGPDALITLDFVDGKYALKACDSRALNKDGLLQDNVDDNALFTMEVYSAALSFKDCEGRYLTAVGTGTMKARNTKVTKDELFTIEDSHPQCKIKSHNGKYVSIKQGKIFLFRIGADPGVLGVGGGVVHLTPFDSELPSAVIFLKPFSLTLMNICSPYSLLPSGHMTFIQRRFNVDATSTLHRR